MKSRSVVLMVCLIHSVYVFSQQLVLRGDYPDPSVVKIGGRYYASATTSNWMPAYPILESKDLLNWKTTGHVFPKLPEWADYYFWAPELSYENGKTYVYYAAHKKGGNLCIGIASADKPAGPYKDHGPLICQEVGSIDAFPMRDENGILYLIWKEDANSVGKPTSIWAQPLNEERTALIGEKKELFRNTEKWEANLVEGVSMIKHQDYFYAFYAAAGCCGAACTYGTGIARAKNLLGPWEKYSKNPVITADEKWSCPGHGTPIEKEGRHYLMYHAYDKKSNVFTGREALLMEYAFTADGWIEFIRTESTLAPPVQNIDDDFKESTLVNSWQWSVFQQPKTKIHRGELYLQASPGAPGNFLGQKTTASDYKAIVKVNIKKSGAGAGIAAIGDEKNTIALLYQNGLLKLVQLKDGKETVLATQKIQKKEKISLQMQVKNAKEFSFFYSIDHKSFKKIDTKPVDGSFLPPWDRAVRAGIVSKGAKESYAVFDRFELINQ